jgi:chromosome segregation ATPase
MNSNNEQIESLTRELDSMRERYLRLVDLHGELQLQNSLLEDRILTIVETYSTEKCQLEQNLIESKQQIHNLQDTVNELEVDKQRYKDDCNLAVRLLHRHPNEFVSTASEQMKNKNESVSTTFIRLK